MKASVFRNFCQEKWFEHKDEIFAWTRQPLTEYDSDYYFRKHKWLLKKMFKEEFTTEESRLIQKEVKRGLKKGNL
jgi:hypothetical protein